MTCPAAKPEDDLNENTTPGAGKSRCQSARIESILSGFPTTHPDAGSRVRADGAAQHDCDTGNPSQICPKSQYSKGKKEEWEAGVNPVSLC